ncbi:hypothetical protein AB0D27_44180 [Streptomyces sp. NPDC048415]|uniref:hypothetical protein n=1 Tax=Streptomyces sp. NPDC048415 TaxID=3154822 RepID=UPI0034250BF7
MPRVPVHTHDFWLSDSKILARFPFDDKDTTLGETRDAAWHHAVRTERFARRVRSTM